MRLALFVFAVMVVAGPLLFGAVDAIFQIALLVLLAVGIWAQPLALEMPGQWGKRLAIAFLAIVVLKEFAPSGWFGTTRWRSALMQDYGLDFPWSHNPEPGRAVDAILSMAVAAIWFLWVRRLAVDRENRPILAWSMFASAAIAAAVSFATRGIDPQAIYGLRYTPGWVGFGPFPNRNHSADFFAIGAVIGCGAITWAAVRKRWFMAAGGVAMLALVLVALLTTQSRGGLVALALGLLIYGGLVAGKVRHRRVLGLAAAAALLIGGLAMTVGAPLLARFHSEHSGGVSNAMRVGIWKDAFMMWKDAPLFGHGLDSFARVFPFYQEIELENQVVLHPESSWLLWLVEFGALPVLLAVAALAIFLRKQLPIAFGRERSFFLSAGGIAAAALILIHGVFDVPAHRWGTAGMALAALAVACPLRFAGRRLPEPRPLALAPLAVALFWALPFFCDAPQWSPLSLSRLVARDALSHESVATSEIEKALRYFPLSSELHQSAGAREAESLGLSAPAGWQQHFAIAARLLPSSWAILQTQARVTQKVSPSLALHYWEMAVERGGIHRDEVLRTAVQETFAASPTAPASWGRFVESKPALLLSYAELLPDPQARYYFGLWWKERALSELVTPQEVAKYYRDGGRWGTRGQLADWMARHPEWRLRDFRAWAGMLHAWGDDKEAWELICEFIPEPEFPNIQLMTSREQLETRWRTAPKNFVNAQELAFARLQAGDAAQSDQLIIEVAARKGAPPWFVRKAAYASARAGRFGDAVAVLIENRDLPHG